MIWQAAYSKVMNKKDILLSARKTFEGFNVLMSSWLPTACHNKKQLYYLQKRVPIEKDSGTPSLIDLLNKRLESFAPCYSQSLPLADLKKTILLSGLQILKKKIGETRQLGSINEWHFVEQKKVGRKPDKNSSPRRLEFMLRNFDQKWQKWRSRVSSLGKFFSLPMSSHRAQQCSKA